MNKEIQDKGIHIGIIPDGSRRWARKNNIAEGDWSTSGKATENIVKHIFFNYPEVSEFSLWAMSTENIERDDYSKNLVYSILEGKFNDLLRSPFLEEEDIKVNVVGSKLKEIPGEIKDLADRVVSKTKNNRARTLNVCIGYGG
ncbi:MAG: undecaprenyl diphosphate synthase family protein, partial [Candidatus Aenigmarchaeota archaeon]|nr:undecaprenyl diphosphate synthase family protein [Candidatus Aenigmarchaeota archaeon]